MRVTFVLPLACLAGGVRVVAILADKLRQRGHDVHVVANVRRKLSLRRRIGSLVKGYGWPQVRRKEPSHFDGLDVPLHRLETCRPVVDADVPDADVIVATWWETVEWVAALSPQKGAKVHFVQGYDTQENVPVERIEAVYDLPLHKVTISQWLADMLKTKFQIEEVSLVPNSVDHNQFFAPPRGKQPRPTVGLVYSAIPIKGADTALRAIDLARPALPELQLIAFGARKPVPHLPMPSGSKFVKNPAQHKIKNLYARADAWLVPSRLEGFGLPILEAMACRTPVIATPAGAAPELIAQGGGLLVEPDDPKDMAAKIVELCSASEEQWKEFSQKAYATATGYTWDDAAGLFELALLRAIERTRQGDLQKAA